MEIGDTFVLRNKDIDDHLWIVISLPQDDANRIVIVSLTTWSPEKDGTCRLDTPDHPWIRHESSVAYWAAKAVPEVKLDALVASGQLIPQAQASKEMLDKLLAGAELSAEIPEDCRKVLVRQGLVER